MNKELIKKNLLTILCVVAIVALFLPLVTFVVESDYADIKESITGFKVANQKFLGYLLLLGPVVLIAMNYVTQLKKYSPILSIAVPIVLILVLIIVFFQAKSVAMQISGYTEDYDVEMKFTMGIGMIIAAISYVAMAVLGFKTYGNPAMFAQLKAVGTGFAETAQAKVSQTVASTTSANSAATTSSGTDSTKEALAVLEQLSKMKDSGIITQEEFDAKKKELLGL